MTIAHYACGTSEHGSSRRRFLRQSLSGLAAGGAIAGGLGSLTFGAAAEQMKSQDMRIVVFNMHGGLSQLESWDPKPGTKTGGPCRSIPTSIPGTHISDLLPYTAKQMHHLCLMRGVNTAEDDHGKGTYLMLTGRRQSAAAEYPQIGAVAARMLNDESRGLPGHIVVTPNGGGGKGNEAAYLGPKYSSISLGGTKPPLNTTKPDAINDAAARVSTPYQPRVSCATKDSDHRCVYSQLRTSVAVDGTQGRFRHFEGVGKRPRPVRQTRFWATVLDGPPLARKRCLIRPSNALQLRHAQRKFHIPHRAAR